MIDVKAQGGSARPMGGGVAGNQDMGKQEFLELLVTQLRNQDPLSPQNSQEFVAQLAQFSSLERLVNMEEALYSMGTATLLTNSQMAAGMLGKEVTVDSSSFHFDGEQSDLYFQVGDDAETVTIKIKDEDGKEIYELEATAADIKAGKVSWTPGDNVESGSYTFEVVAKDKDGNSVASSTEVKTKVVAIELKGGAAQYKLENGETVGLTSLKSVEDS